MAVISHPPQSPDLAPCDFLPISKKLSWRWKDAGFIPLRKSRPNLTEKDFQEAIQKWRRRWDRCLHAGENYFEGYGGREALWWVLWFLQRQSGIFLIPHSK
jgi:hypothetical protein